MIICMDSEMFLEHFVLEQSPKTVLDATYIVASNKIRFGQKYSGQIEVLFFPNERTIMCMNDEKSLKSKSNSKYVRSYFDELSEDIRSIAILIKMTVLTNTLTVILTTKREAKAYGHIKLFHEYVLNTFGFDIPYYEAGMDLTKKIPNGNELVSRCEKIIKRDKKKEKKFLMKSEKGQREYFSCMKTKELKKQLKKEGLYQPGMDNDEMIDIALTFLV